MPNSVVLFLDQTVWYFLDNTGGFGAARQHSLI